MCCFYYVRVWGIRFLKKILCVWHKIRKDAVNSFIIFHSLWWLFFFTCSQHMYSLLLHKSGRYLILICLANKHFINFLIKLCPFSMDFSYVFKTNHDVHTKEKNLFLLFQCRKKKPYYAFIDKFIYSISICTFQINSDSFNS